MEDLSTNWTSQIILTLPLPDGTFLRFIIQEYPLMEAGLAAKYPNLETYKAQGIDVPAFRNADDQSVVGDYDGDNKSDIAIFRPSVFKWWILRSTAGLFAVQFGSAGDKPVQGDYTGDGKADVAFWQPSNGNWTVLRSENSSFFAFPWGAAGDTPKPGDYDGVGKFDAAVFRPTESRWYIQRTTAGNLIQGFGQAGDVPLPSVYIP